jgi:hypothetical protein
MRRGLVADEERGVVVAQVGEWIPLQHLKEMPQCLDTWDQFDPEHLSVAVDRSRLVGGVATAHVPEVRSLWHDVAVLGVQHEHVEPHQGHPPKQTLHRLHRGHGIALGHIDHRANHVEARRLRYVNITALG